MTTTPTAWSKVSLALVILLWDPSNAVQKWGQIGLSPHFQPMLLTQRGTRCISPHDNLHIIWPKLL